MVATAIQEKIYTVPQYLELEAQTGERHAFYNGIIVAMPGGTIAHNRITKNMVQYLGNLLDQQNNLEIFGSDQKIYLPKYHYYVYPDAVVVVQPPIIAEEETNAITNPLLIVEVLSPSTEAYDRGQKFLEYRSLPSFREYVLVRQNAPEVLTFFREEPDLWRENMVTGLDQSVYFRSIEAQLALQLIYRNIEFAV